MAVDLDEALASDAAGRDLEEAAGTDLADVADEGEAVAVVDALHGGLAQASGETVAGAGEVHAAAGAGRHLLAAGRRLGHLLAPALDDHPSVVLGGGGAHVEGGRLRQVVHPVEDALVLLGRDHVFGGAAAGGYQEEEVEHHGAVACGDLGDGVQLMEAVAADRGANLEGHAQVAQVVHDLQGALEGAGALAEGVVAILGGAVQADVSAGDAGVAGLAQPLAGGEGRGAGRKGHPEPAVVGGVGDEVEDVAPHHGVAAGEHQDGPADLSDLVDEAEAFLGGQLARVALGLGLGAAVDAPEGAGARYLPGDGEGSEVEVDIGDGRLGRGAAVGRLGVAHGGFGVRRRLLSHLFVNYQGVSVSKASAGGEREPGTGNQVRGWGPCSGFPVPGSWVWGCDGGQVVPGAGLEPACPSRDGGF